MDFFGFGLFAELPGCRSGAAFLCNLPLAFLVCRKLLTSVYKVQELLGLAGSFSPACVMLPSHLKAGC